MVYIQVFPSGAYFLEGHNIDLGYGLYKSDSK